MAQDKLTGAENVHWNLSELYASLSDPQILKDVDDCLQLAKEFHEQYRGKLGKEETTAELMLRSMKDRETIWAKFSRARSFVGLMYSVETMNTEIHKLLAKMEEVGTEISNLMLFASIEFTELSDEKVAELRKSPLMKEYDNFIHQSRVFKPYILSEEVEKALNMKEITGASAFTKLYEELTASLQFKVHIDGEEETLNDSQIRSLRSHPNPDIRLQSVTNYYSVYEENSLVLSTIFNNIIKDRVIDCKQRGYKSSIEPMNLHNQLSEEVINTLVNVTTDNNQLVHDYYKIKAKLLGVEKLRLCDIYAPVTQDPDFYTWDEAKAIVLEAYKEFDPFFYETASKLFENNWVDAATINGKRGGAFCSGLHSHHPYVFLNFLGKQRDIMTLAHEFGHAVHFTLSLKQNLVNYHAILPLAEVASTFGEMVVTDYLLKKITDKQAKIALLTSKLEDLFATCNRQNMFTRFELASHQIITEELPSKEQLCECYMEELKRMFGDSVEIQPDYQWEWATIPHIFHTPFYVYSYNFAQLLVIALYEQYLQKGESFKAGYFKLLESGSNASPSELLKNVGITIEDSNFWQSGFDYIRKHLLDELKALV